MNWGGFEKYLLVGYDFSWKPEGNYYAWENPKPKRFYMTHRTALDSKGDIVLTGENLIFSSRWLESYCQAFSLPVVNCTGGGILNVKPGDLEKELLRVNGVEEGKVEVIRHGVSAPSAVRIADSGEGIGVLNLGSRKDAKDAEGMEEIQDIGYRISDIGSTKDAEQKKGDNGKALKLVFLGRVAPEKGIDVVLRAMEMVKIPVELDVYGIGAKGDRGERIGDRGFAEAGGGRREAGSGENPEILNPKSRIRWLEPVKPEKVVETIGKYDALVVPSVCLETGPLVVLEAFAAGVPVIGSRLGGIAEMVRDGVDGLLFEVGKPEDLADKIQEFPFRMENIKARVPRVKTTREVSSEHLDLYRQALLK